MPARPTYLYNIMKVELGIFTSLHEVTNADASATCDDATHQLLEFACIHTPNHSEYLSKHVVSKIHNNKTVIYVYHVKTLKHICTAVIE